LTQFQNQKNHQVWVFGKNQIKKATGSGYFKNFKELLGFMPKEQTKAP
jgi:hypothetical protein